jgi:bifunctional ADP-heptose synthase (sugar kinase/adenylyltransferase)
VDRPGGAGLAALFAAATDEAGGREVVLVAAVAADPAGERLRELLAAAGVRLVALPMHGATPEKIRMRAGDHLLMRLDRGDGPSVVGAMPTEAAEVLHAASGILVSDYGRGVTGVSELRAVLAERAHATPIVWDPHPRGAAPVPGTRLATPNSAEADTFARTACADGPAESAARSPAGLGHTGSGYHVTAGARHAAKPGNGNGGNGGRAGGKPAGDGPELAGAAATAVRLRRCWSVEAVAVTLAERGAVVSDGVHPPLLVPTPFPARGDSCGAGDRFASAALTTFADGGAVLDAVTAAVTAATGYVAAGGALALLPELHRRFEDAAPVGAR